MNLTATDSSLIDSDVTSVAIAFSGAAGASVSFGIAVTLAENSIGSTTRAAIDGSAVTANGGVTLTATVSPAAL